MSHHVALNYSQPFSTGYKECRLLDATCAQHKLCMFAAISGFLSRSGSRCHARRRTVRFIGAEPVVVPTSPHHEELSAMLTGNQPTRTGEDHASLCMQIVLQPVALDSKSGLISRAWPQHKVNRCY